MKKKLVQKEIVAEQAKNLKEDIISVIQHARKKLKEYKRLLSLDERLRYSATIEDVDILMNSSESLILELDSYINNIFQKNDKLREDFIKEIYNKVNQLKENIDKISLNLAKLSLSTVSASDLYLE